MPSVAYPVRTPLLYWAVVGALFVLCLTGVGLVVYSLRLGISPLLDLFGLVLLAVPFIYLGTTGEYRAHGAIHLAPGEVTVPDPRGRPLQFRVPGLRLSFTRVRVRLAIEVIPVGTFDRGVVLELADAFNKRRLSTLTLVERDHQQALLDDLERVLRSEDPHGPHPRVAAASPRPRSELEAQLDRELAALD
jgi:hypothetical protein